MAQYINKDALVAEIVRRKEINKYRDTNDSLFEDEAIISFIDTLEVKEVDLEKEINEWQGCKAFPEGTTITPLPKAMDIVERTAKHFFELGVQQSKNGNNNEEKKRPKKKKII